MISAGPVAAAAVAAGGAAVVRVAVVAQAVAVLPPAAAAMMTPTTAAVATTTSRSERMRASLLLTSAALCWVALGVPAACSNKRQADRTSAAPALADLPEPSTIVAELALAHPGAAFRALRELGSPTSGLLPAGFPVFTATALGLPPLSADSFDAEIPVVGALAQTAQGELGWVVAVHAVSGPELVAKLSTGDHPPFRALPGDPRGLISLQPAADGGALAPKLALAVFDNYLVAASEGDLLASVGPYVARMLPRRPPRSAALTVHIAQRALAASVIPALRALWASYRTTLARQEQTARAEHGGRAADFGDPAQVILGLDAAVESVLSVIGGASAVELAADPFPNRLELTLLLTPAPGSPAQQLISSLVGGDAKSLLTLPVETRFAFGSSRSPAERDDAGKAAGDDWVRLLGSRLSERDARTLRGVLADWELGRGARTTYGFLADSAPGAFIVTDVAEPTRLKRAGHGVFKLLGLAGLRAPLAEFLGEPHVSESVQAHTEFANDVQLAKITFSPSSAATPHTQPSSPLSCAWFVTDEVGYAASGKDANSALQKLVLAARGRSRSLASTAGVAEGVQRAGNQAALFAYFDAQLGPKAAPAEDARQAPLFLSAGKRENIGFLRIEISKPAVDLALGQLAFGGR